MCYNSSDLFYHSTVVRSFFSQENIKNIDWFYFAQVKAQLNMMD